MFIRKVLTILCVLLMMSSLVYAQDLSVPAELSAYGASVYSQARSGFGRSFSGYCGTYVRYQLFAMGIFSDNLGFRGNGNQWYSNFDNVQITSGGYYVYRESGRDCLKKLSEKYGNELNNIVLSFPIQSGYSASNPGAGHALILYKLKDGIAYYSESFSFGNHPEGSVIAENAEDLIARYSRRHGDPIGCVLLSEKPYFAVEEKTVEAVENPELLFGSGSPMMQANIGTSEKMLFVIKEFEEMLMTETIA